MQRDQFELAQQLCVMGGTIMEDASVQAVSRMSEDRAARSARLERLARDGSDIAALLAAAAVLDRRLVEPE